MSKVKRTAEERSAQAKEIWFKKELANLRPETLNRIQRDFGRKVQDDFEKHYRVGKYAPQTASKVDTAPPPYPTFDEVAKPMRDAMMLMGRGFSISIKEETKENWEMAYHHMTVAMRYLHVATKP